MNNADELGNIAKEEFSIRDTSNIHQLVSKWCVIDHNQSKRQCFTLASSDSEGCYNWSIHPEAVLALLRVGIPHTKIHSMFSTVQRMTHIIRKSFGDYEITYGGDDIGSWENYL